MNDLLESHDMPNLFFGDALVQPITRFGELPHWSTGLCRAGLRTGDEDAPDRRSGFESELPKGFPEQRPTPG